MPKVNKKSTIATTLTAREQLQVNWTNWLRSEEARLKAIEVRTKEENGEFMQVSFSIAGFNCFPAYQRFISIPENFLLHAEVNDPHLNELAKQKKLKRPRKPLTLAQAKKRHDAQELRELDAALEAEGLI